MTDSQGRQADEPTPEMVEAGAEALSEYLANEDIIHDFDEAARLAYRIMSSLRDRTRAAT